MREFIPPSSVIDDLLTENWELRWQVLKLLQQTHLILQDFARSSQEYKKAQSLCRKLAERLNGASDVNLHLVLAAAWFLGGSHFLLLALETIGIKNLEADNNEIIKLKKALSGNQPELSFFSYFKCLLNRSQAVDATKDTAICIFPPELSFNLLLEIPEPTIRFDALAQLKEAYPDTFFNDLLLNDDFALIRKNPELLKFIDLPLPFEIKTKLDDFTAALLKTNSPAVEFAAQAAGRLQLIGCKPQLKQLLDELPAAAGALARLQDQTGCQKLLQRAKSWRWKKRETALSHLSWCPTVEAVELLQKRVQQGKLDERRQALMALGKMRTPLALQTLHTLLGKTSKEKEILLILQALAGPKWPVESRVTADLLSQWSDQTVLYPHILKALAALDFSDKWAKILLQTSSPVLQPHLREIALFMCRYAERAEIREHLLTLIKDIDWSFSFQLLNLLAPQFKSSDINMLLRLMQDRDEKRELTIKERLTKGQDIEKISAALADFFQNHPEIANIAVKKIVAQAITATTPTQTELYTKLQQQPEELIELISNSETDQNSSDPRDYHLLLTLNTLAEIEVDGSDCFALVVHRTRRYSGFFRETITTIIKRLLNTPGELDNAGSLASLHQIIDTIRGQSYFSELRELVLKRINQITRNSRELIVFNEASQTRDLRILKVKKLDN